LRKNTEPEHIFPRILLLAVLVWISCGTVVLNTEEVVSDYSAAAAWKWQNTHTFALRGRARLEGESQVYSGPFVLLASSDPGRLRADFCGPDGSTVLSLKGDSTGFLFYYPNEGTALFVPGGLPLGDGLIEVNAVVSLLRTGFPAIPEPWEMAETYAENSQGSAVWSFASGASTMNAILEQGKMFPALESAETRLEVTASSWHDSFRAWPMEWHLSSPSLGVVAKIRSFQEDTVENRRWDLLLPVIPDTLQEPPAVWRYTQPIPIR